ncbi:hypothetical protein OG216_40320 [Streptomycetaceae bacterium NBC_01309]
MLTKLHPTTEAVASSVEQTALTALLAEDEAPISDAPMPCPASALYLLLLLSPKQPKEKGR